MCSATLQNSIPAPDITRWMNQKGNKHWSRLTMPDRFKQPLRKAFEILKNA
jgi:alpha-amylase/alpha-mannosidase (GH57 family)